MSATGRRRTRRSWMPTFWRSFARRKCERIARRPLRRLSWR